MQAIFFFSSQHTN